MQGNGSRDLLRTLIAKTAKSEYIPLLRKKIIIHVFHSYF